MKQLDGYKAFNKRNLVTKEDHIWLKQAQCVWNTKFDMIFLWKLDFLKCEYNPNVCDI
jgi:hypothetical protein